MNILDLEAIRRTALRTDPFEYIVTRDFIRPTALPAVVRDFPRIDHTGLLPVAASTHGPVFGQLIGEIESEALSRAFSEKFDVPLSPAQMMMTLRGNCGSSDGRIHADSASKVVTALLYLNEPWTAKGGRLRLLRGPDNIEDMVAEVPPDGGTLVAFRRTDRSYHGHTPYVGVRRYIMFNWMTDHATARRELMRHRLSAATKRLIPQRRYVP